MPTPSLCTQTTLASALGPLLLTASEHGLCGVWFENQRHRPADPCPTQVLVNPQHPLLQAAAAQLQAFFDGHRTHFDLPLDLSAGTPFQQSVWRALLTIGPGQTCSYGELAQQLGRPSAVRAVGAAIGRNPLSIVVPCHRVLGANGSLTGYAGGLDRKAALLALERGARC